MKYLEDQVLQLPLSRSSNLSGSLNGRGEKPLFAGKHFQNEVTGSRIKISRQLLKGGLLFAYVFFGYITLISSEFL